MAVVSSAAAGVRAVERGAGLIRLRAPELTVRQLEAEATALIAAVPVSVIVSSRVDLALAVGAAGVHLPAGDIPVADARRLAPELLIGRSIHDPAKAVRTGADYLLFGPIWATPSHPGLRATGLEALREVALRARPVPVLAIGGVDEARTERVMRAGAAGWAAIRMYGDD